MWIRSQDKQTLFDMTGSNIEIGIEGDIYGYGNSAENDVMGTFLGQYSTEKRAIEVLDEICNHYELNKTGVFQMPYV